MTQPSRTFGPGLFWAFLAILIWSGSLVLLRLGVTTGLTAQDLTALRFAVAAALLLPVLLRRGTGSDTLRPTGMLLMIVTFGAPYILLVSQAMVTAPAAAAGALNPGVMAIASLFLARVLGGARLTVAHIAGLGVILLGLWGFLFTGEGVTTGHMLLALTGMLWASYTAIVRQKRVPALNATALVAVGSAALYLPVYALVLPKQIAAVPLSDILLQAVFQGVLVSVIAFYAFTRSTELLGPVAGPSLPALIPVVTLGLEALILGERAGPAEILGAALVSAGLALVLAGPALLRRARQPAAPRKPASAAATASGHSIGDRCGPSIQSSRAPAMPAASATEAEGGTI